METAWGSSDSWKGRRARKRAEEEAFHLVREARRILRKKSYRIPESVATTVSSAVDEVTSAAEEMDQERLRKAITALDEAMDKHLAFARKSTLREYAESIVVAIAVALLLRAFVVEPFQIPSGSMIPTLQVGDHIFVSKFAYGLSIPFTNAKIFTFKQPRRGDVIVFKFPKDPKTDYIKRVVGLPGDVVEVRRNEVFINGVPVPREHVDKPYRYIEHPLGGLGAEQEAEMWMESLDGKRHATIQDPDHGTGRYSRAVVEPDSVFVMGDNRDNSSDSRVWGTLPRTLIKGKALIVWWSRGNADGLWGLSKSFWQSIRWHRFFSVVE